jgi:hypothetical protein
MRNFIKVEESKDVCKDLNMSKKISLISPIGVAEARYSSEVPTQGYQ